MVTSLLALPDPFINFSHLVVRILLLRFFVRLPEKLSADVKQCVCVFVRAGWCACV